MRVDRDNHKVQSSTQYTKLVFNVQKIPLQLLEMGENVPQLLRRTSTKSTKWDASTKINELGGQTRNESEGEARKNITSRCKNQKIRDKQNHH